MFLGDMLAFGAKKDIQLLEPNQLLAVDLDDLISKDTGKDFGGRVCMQAEESRECVSRERR